MAERWKATMRQATPEDLAAMEWEREHRRDRRLYQQALLGVVTAPCCFLLADAGDRAASQVVVRLGAAPPQLGDLSGLDSRHAVHVRPAFRHQGVDGQWIAEVAEVLRRRRDRRVALSSARAMAAAQRPYERLVCAIVAERFRKQRCFHDEGHRRHVREPAHAPERVSQEATCL